MNCGGRSGAYIQWSDSGVLHGNHLWSTWWPEGIWPSSIAVYTHPRHHGFHWLCIFVCMGLEIESQQLRGCTWETFLFSLCINIHLWPKEKRKNHNYRFKNEKQTGRGSAALWVISVNFTSGQIIRLCCVWNMKSEAIFTNFIPHIIREHDRCALQIITHKLMCPHVQYGNLVNKLKYISLN